MGMHPTPTVNSFRNQAFTRLTIHPVAPLLFQPSRGRMQDVVFHVDKTNFESAVIKVSAHWQVPYHAPINELGGTGVLWQRVTIATLPDGPLLDIFGFYVEKAYEGCYLDEVPGIKLLEAWCTLVHVCQRWREVIFASPRRLNIRLVCTRGTPVREMLNIWPTLPIVVQTRFRGSNAELRDGKDSKNVDNTIAALGHRDRVCQIGLMNLQHDQSPLFAAILQESFPALTRLYFETKYGRFSMLHPDSFLGGSAPRLRSLTLNGVPFPELPKLLLSTKDLIELRLDVPDSGYILPEAMVTCFPSLTSLEKISLTIGSLRHRLDESSRPLPALTRVDLPGLCQLELNSDDCYVEDLVSRINAPRLTHVSISLYYASQYDISQFCQFIRRVENFEVLHQARVKLEIGYILTEFGLSVDPTDGTTLDISISCSGLEWEFPSLALLSTLSSPPFRLSSFERLELWEGCAPSGYWDDPMQDTQWLEPFRPFTAVKDLYLEDALAIPVAHTLRQLTGNRATEVFPALQNIFLKSFLEGDFKVRSRRDQPLEVVLEAIEPFIAARQLSGCPVAVQYCN